MDKRIIFIASALALMPAAAHAGTFTGLVAMGSSVLTALVPFLIGLGLVLFLVGLVKYMLAQDNEQGRATARQMMLWGIIMLFVMVSVWGLVNILSTSLGIKGGAAPATPTVP